MKDDLEIKLSRRSILKGSSALALVLAGSTIIARNVEADSKLTSEAIKKVVGSKGQGILPLWSSRITRI